MKIPVEIFSMLASVGAVIVAIISFANSKHKDSQENSADLAMIKAQLNSIQTGVNDVKVEMRVMRDRVDTMSERLAQCEVKIKSLEKEVYER